MRSAVASHVRAARAPAGVRRWAMPAAAAVGEQGVTAATNFGVNLALARWLSPAAYGEFALGFAIVLICASLHAALVVEPMSVLGPSRQAGATRAYLRAQIRVTLWLGVGAASLLGLGAAVAGAAGAETVARALVVAAIMILPAVAHVTGRRMLFVVGRAPATMGASLVFALVAVVALVASARVAGPDPVLGAIVLALAASAAAIRSTTSALHAAPPASDAAAGARALAEGWDYGKWVLAGSAMTTAATQVQMIVLAGFAGAAGAGALRAMQLVMLPMAQVVIAITAVALPALARDAGRGLRTRVRARARTITVALVGFAVAYEAVLIATHATVERVLFAGKFAASSGLIAVLGLVPVLTALTAGWSLALRAAQRPKHHLIAAAVTAPVGLLTAAVFTARWGVAGAAWSIVVTYAATAAIAWRLYAAWTREEADDG